MRLTESPDRLTMDDSARPIRVLGGVFVASGLFVLSLPFHMGDWVTMPAWQKLGLVTIGLGHLAGGAFTVMQPAASHLELDQSSGDGTLRWLRPWGRERMTFGPESATRFRLDDVSAVDIVRTIDDDGEARYALRLALRDGRTLAVHANPVADARAVTLQAERVRAFLGIGMEQRAAA